MNPTPAKLLTISPTVIAAILILILITKWKEKKNNTLDFCEEVWIRHYNVDL